MQIPIEDVVLKPRIRKNLGDLAPLMESMKKHGLLNPITITATGVLIAGHRRLESARKLGWSYIEARTVEEPDEIKMLELEIEENIQRRNLSSEELSDAYERLEKLRNPGFWQRLKTKILNFLARIFRLFRTRE